MASHASIAKVLATSTSHCNGMRRWRGACPFVSTPNTKQARQANQGLECAAEKQPRSELNLGASPAPFLLITSPLPLLPLRVGSSPPPKISLPSTPGIGSSSSPALATAVRGNSPACAAPAPPCAAVLSPHPTYPRPPNFPLLSAFPFPLPFLLLLQPVLAASRSIFSDLPKTHFYPIDTVLTPKSPCLPARERPTRKSWSACPVATRSLRKSK